MSGNLGSGTVTYSYSTSLAGTFTSTKPSAAGTYYVKATIAATTNYNGATTEAVQFAIAEATSSSSSSAPSSSSVVSSSSSGETILDDFADTDNFAYTGDRWSAKITGTNTSIGNTRLSGTNKDNEPFYNINNGNGYGELTSIDIWQTTWDDYGSAALKLSTEHNGSYYNLSQCTGGISYKFKGSAHRVILGRTYKGYHVEYYGANGNTDGEVTASASAWKTVTLKTFSRDQYDEACDTYDECNVAFSWENVEDINWVVRSFGDEMFSLSGGSLQVDDVKCLGNMPIDLSNLPSSSSVAASSSSVQPSSSSIAASSSSAVISSSSSSAPTPVIANGTFSGNFDLQVRNGMLLITAPFSSTGNNINVQLYNLNGTKIHSFSFVGGVYNVPLNALPKGLYIVKANFGSERKVKKVMVK